MARIVTSQWVIGFLAFILGPAVLVMGLWREISVLHFYKKYLYKDKHRHIVDGIS